MIDEKGQRHPLRWVRTWCCGPHPPPCPGQVSLVGLEHGLAPGRHAPTPVRARRSPRPLTCAWSRGVAW